ncbi:hypothetical protein FA15DRAFT_707909 [Coprinopsis marcescibilis]|uniref:DUF6593 domain-containing protein n=1 Tax=Coprinopsis marcescibilis TaxID=230819 RepID=A0A5C3KKF1_COPMA|nr:hypothetical protein FA15DRAFT_707909 [Coprinopsis marcescibilis]
MPDPIILVLTPDDPCNTTITNSETDEVLYTVFTERDNDVLCTRVNNDDNHEIANWKWGGNRPDSLTMTKSGITVPAKEWLTPSSVPFSDAVSFTVHFSDNQEGNYRWTGTSPGKQLELRGEEDKKHTIAFFKSISRPPLESAPGQATLTLTGEAQEIMDMVVISFLLLEKGRRTNAATMGGLTRPRAGVKAAGVGELARVFLEGIIKSGGHIV